MEIEYAHFSKAPAFHYGKQHIQKNIDDNSERLLSAYESKRIKCEEEQQRNFENILKDNAAFRSKTCRYCGKPLRFISSYGFWGCTNYQNKSTLHSTFNEEHFVSDAYVTISTHWVSEIISECNLKGAVKAKDLLSWYAGQGLQDLRRLFGKSPAINSIDSYTKTKIRSTKQEQEAYDLLKSQYQKVVSQQCISYKIHGNKETFCIPDFICGNASGVLVADAKLDVVNDEKMELYISLVKFILSHKNDQRTVEGAHIMYNSPYLPRNSKFKLLILK